MTKLSEKRKVRCAYRGSNGQCLNSFDERGPKKYCRQGHQVKAYQRRSGTGKGRDDLREAAIARDGGCARRLLPEQIKTEEEQESMGGFALSDYRRSLCRGKLLVRTVDSTKPRTLENVETLCGRHFGRLSDSKLRERLGPERYRETKKGQARHYYRMGAMKRKMIRIYKGPPKNPIDFIDYI